MHRFAIFLCAAAVVLAAAIGLLMVRARLEASDTCFEIYDVSDMLGKINGRGPQLTLPNPSAPGSGQISRIFLVTVPPDPTSGCLLALTRAALAPELIC